MQLGDKKGLRDRGVSQGKLSSARALEGSLMRREDAPNIRYARMNEAGSHNGQGASTRWSALHCERAQNSAV